jgi:AraC-like DNA-binding protein
VLAAAVGFSPSRETHLVRDQVGIPLRTYPRLVRFLIAAEALRGASLTDAAHRAGFADVAPFIAPSAITPSSNPVRYSVPWSGSRHSRSVQDAEHTVGRCQKRVERPYLSSPGQGCEFDRWARR